ncbi:Flagellar Member 3 [Trypanosoma cruzi]|uniref:Flagellar Member 3 n=1 Tax=Trypanosoma cruzi TaxID=5693 RepID=A0A2V2W553_TRYCR|nr:Flagellar Member 3 [Trypanosoma cruzi]
MIRRAEELARNVKLVDAYRGNGNEYVRARNPFLVYEDRKCVLLSELPLAGDGVYPGLVPGLSDCAGGRRGKCAADRGAGRMRFGPVRMSWRWRFARGTRGCRITHSSRPRMFLVGLKHCCIDAEFQQLRERYDELSKDPQGNAEALRELEDAMEARSRAIAGGVADCRGD